MAKSRWLAQDKKGKHEDITVDAEDLYHAKIEACRQWDEPWVGYARNCAVTLTELSTKVRSRRVLSVRDIRK